MEPLNLLITGTASGIGQAVAEYFLSRGHMVYGIDRAQSAEREHFRSFTANITDRQALLSVSDQLWAQGVRLDIILNIAGIHKMVSLVESESAEMKQLVDVNLSGPMLVNRIFHKHLKPGGRILLVTSEVAAFDPMPFNGLYSVTKTALDAYAQALRQELNLIGQTVITIQPGAVDTPLSTASIHSTQALADSTVLFRHQAKHFAGLASKFMGTPIRPEALATLIYKAATDRHPRLVYRKHRNVGLVLLSLLPKRAQCGVIQLLLNSGR